MTRRPAPDAARYRPTLAAVDLDAIRWNVRSLAPAGADVMAVVKANGYGHGDVAVAQAALEAGATWLGVALVEEGIRLREAGLDAPILVLTECPPGSEADALLHRLTPALYTQDGLARMAAAGRGAAVHVKVDTGMHRVGLAPGGVGPFLRSVLAAGLTVEGLWTHFAVSEDAADPATGEQLRSFLATVDRLAEDGIARPRYLHAANTGAVMAHPASHLDMVRLGIGMYGIAPGPALAGRYDLRPAMTWTSRVAMTKRLPAGERLSYGLRYRLARDATIATVPVGYADGYRRNLGAGGEVLIGGRRRPLAGTVTMDQILVDCGDDPVEPGDEVVLIGAQGDERISAEEVAEQLGTIGYEIVCGVSERVPRVYRSER